MRHHHHFEGYFRNTYQDDFDAEEAVDNIEHLESEVKKATHHRNARKSIDDYMEKKRMRELDQDPFEDFFDGD